MSPDEFKARASAASQPLSGSIGFEPTKEYQTLKEKYDSGKAFTEKQQEKWIQYQYRIENQQMPKTLKTYCDVWAKERVYGVYREFWSKYTSKGTEQEDQAIELINDYLKLKTGNEWYLSKYPDGEPLKNDYVTGHPDIFPPMRDYGFDAKCSWDVFNFPTFPDGETVDCGIPELSGVPIWPESAMPTQDYASQMQSYMELSHTDAKYKGVPKTKMIVAYCLVTTPMPLIEKEAYDIHRKEGVEYEKALEFCIEKHTYDHTPLDLRVRLFLVERDTEFGNELRKRVEYSRNYLQTLKY